MRENAQQASEGTQWLLEQYAQNPTAALRDALVEKHLYIAAIIARRFSGRGVDYDDLYQVASLALFKAIDRFDITKGIKFVSFVTPTMVGEVKNYFRDRSRTIRLPRRGAELVRLLRGAMAELEQQLGRAPRVDELSEYLHITEDEVLEGLEASGAASPRSLDAVVLGDEDGQALSATLGIEETGYQAFERDDMLKRSMALLDERQRQVIHLRYFENRSQQETAKAIGVSQMTVSRIERQALQVMREQIHSEDIPG